LTWVMIADLGLPKIPLIKLPVLAYRPVVLERLRGLEGILTSRACSDS